jgi:arylsulfatase A-like enzyme
MNYQKTTGTFLMSAVALTIGCNQETKTSHPPYPGSVPFEGKIALDVRQSTPDWKPFMPKTAPAGSPNVLFILFDDTGLAAWSTYGGRINMPTLDSLAANGLTYTQWHTCALSSPTRATLLTGRNHHLCGMASIEEIADGYPGANGFIPAQCATVAQILQANGWSTFWIGKDHNVPMSDVSSGASRVNWPLNKGFDRFYGFLGGETNEWFPDLVEDNRFIEQPYLPDQGYHLSKDLADQAIRMIRDQKATDPKKPWYMWYCPGANHAPHQAPQDYIDKYRGKFDDGYDAYRKWVLERMIAKGILPEGTQLTPWNPMPKDVANPADVVLPWESLSPEQKQLFSRMAEVYAAMSEYTDAQIGRVIEYLKRTGQFDNTVIIYAADNGASGEGSPNGSVNENKFFNNYPDELAENLKYLDILGGPATYEHYPTGWAAAFSTPFKMFKRYANYAGGTCDPLVICWPKGIKAKGELRSQYHHSVDIVPTILDICGLQMPAVYNGVEQYPLSGVSMKYTFDAKPDDPSQKHKQYYTMMGTRAIWEDGWKAVAVHAPMSGKGHFEQDVWQLYNTDKDRSEINDLAAQYPDKLEHLKALYETEATYNFVLPLDDRTTMELIQSDKPLVETARDRYLYFPGTSFIPEGIAANLRGRSFKILSDIEITDPKSNGVLFTLGSGFGGEVLFIKDGKLYYVYNFLGIKPEQVFASSETLKPGKYTVGMEFIWQSMGKYHESLGTVKLYINDKVVAEGPVRTQAGRFGLGGGMRVGYNSPNPVSELYTAQGNFSGGTILFVGMTAEETKYLDLEQEAQRVLLKD